MSTKSSVEVSKQRRLKTEATKDRRDKVNELLGLYIQLSDAPASERAALRQAIYEAEGVDVTAVVVDPPAVEPLIR